ncbi:transposase, partial [Dysgonomonas reticulitermitis]
MFVRKKKNRSGTTSVVIVAKGNGKTNYVKTIGTSSDESEIERLYQQGKKWLSAYLGERDMFAEHTREQEEKQVTERLLGNIENILLNGTQLILNHVFQLVGFDRIDDEILKHLVVSRLCQPRSKVATVDYLKSYFDEDVELHKIYRYLDKLHDTQKDQV